MSPQFTPTLEAPRLGEHAPALRVEHLSKTFPGTRASDRCFDRDPGGRGSRARRSERLREVDADQDAGRLPRPRRRCGGRARRSSRSRSATRSRTGFGSCIRTSVWCSSSARWTTSRCAVTSSAASADGSAGASRSARRIGSSSASTSTSTSTGRSPRRRRFSAPSWRSPARSRAGTAARTCWFSTSQRPCSPTTRSSGCWTMVREVQRSGTSVLYVSHRLDEIFEIADRVTVLRAGRVVETLPVSDIDQRGLAKLMVGTEVDPDYRAPVAVRPDSPVVLELRDVRARRLRGLDLDVHRGEILGIAGLRRGRRGGAAVPAGRAPTPSGDRQHPAAAAARPSGPTSPRPGQLGIPLVPADRAHEAIVPEFARGREPDACRSSTA